jgi:hypothetical protein
VKKHVAVVLVVLAGMIGAVAPAQALTFVGTRGGLGATDYVDWSVLGPTYSLVSHPFTILSAGGVSVTVSKLLPGAFERVDQGNGWAGNFAPGDALLWTYDGGSPSTNPVSVMDFGGVGILAGGLQIQSDYFGAFTARVEAFDAADTSLGFYTAAGNSTWNGDNGALFLGVSSDVPIHRLAFSLDAAPGGTIGDFAVNRLDFVPAGAIPEPITMAGLCLGLGGLTAYLRRRRA